MEATRPSVTSQGGPPTEQMMYNANNIDPSYQAGYTQQEVEGKSSDIKAVFHEPQ